MNKKLLLLIYLTKNYYKNESFSCFYFFSDSKIENPALLCSNKTIYIKHFQLLYTYSTKSIKLSNTLHDVYIHINSINDSNPGVTNKTNISPINPFFTTKKIISATIIHNTPLANSTASLKLV